MKLPWENEEIREKEGRRMEESWICIWIGKKQEWLVSINTHKNNNW